MVLIIVFINVMGLQGLIFVYHPVPIPLDPFTNTIGIIGNRYFGSMRIVPS